MGVDTRTETPTALEVATRPSGRSRTRRQGNAAAVNQQRERVRLVRRGRGRRGEARRALAIGEKTWHSGQSLLEARDSRIDVLSRPGELGPVACCPAPVDHKAPQSGTRRRQAIMIVSDAPSCACGGQNVQAARTDRLGDGTEAVLYLHYLLKCARCGLVTEDARMRHLNAAGVAGARARYG
jgi:hypothetical protein